LHGFSAVWEAAAECSGPTALGSAPSLRNAVNASAGLADSTKSSGIAVIPAARRQSRRFMREPYR
jgi:hypothetical protein